MAIETPEDLKQFPLYDHAAGEVREMLDGLPDVRWPTAAVRELMTAAWLRGASWKAHGTN